MGNTSRTWLLLWGALLAVMTFKGCIQKTESFPELSSASAVQLQYQADAAQEQIEALEMNVADLKAQGEAVPPGYYAQLGLLYFSLSNAEQGRQPLSADQDPFADATAQMNELMDSAKSVQSPESIDTPTSPQARIETPVRMDVGPFVRSFVHDEAERLIF